ncbi:SWIM zinc finger family protein [bacterium]|nr:SWIM zinc finger family protein [bacterium]
MGFSLYEIDDYQDVAKPSDQLGENWYLDDVFVQTRPEVMHYDDNSTENTDDKRNPYFRERDRDEKEDKGDHQNDDQSYIKNINNWDERDDYLVKKSVQSVVANYRMDTSPLHLTFSQKNPNTKTAVSLNELMRDTSNMSIKRVHNVSDPTQIKFERGKRRYVFRVKSTESYSKSSGHQVVLQFGKNPKIKDIRLLDAKVSCSCPFWKYYGPDYLAKRNKYLEGMPYSDGSAPNIRNPDFKTDPNYICKHVYAVGEVIREWIVKEKLDTYKEVEEILKTLSKIRDIFGLDNTVKGIKDITFRLHPNERKKLVSLSKDFEKAKNDKRKEKVFVDLVEELTDQLDIQEKSFLQKIIGDLRNFFNVVKREEEREKRQKDLEDKRKERQKKKEEDTLKRKEKSKKPMNRRQKNLKRFLKKQYIEESILNPKIANIIEIYLKENGETYGDL